MITDEECTLWRAAADTPERPGALEAYADWLLTHDARRGELLAKRLRDRRLSLNEWSQERHAWESALGIKDLFKDIDFDPLPETLAVPAARIAAVEPILDRLPFLEVRLRFYASEDPVAVFASPVVAKIRRLSFWAYADTYEPDYGGGYVRGRITYAGPVLAALCASPHVAGLEELTLFEHDLGPRCATLVARGQFTRLARLSVVDEKIGDEGAIALAGSPVVASLRSLFLHGCGIGAAGAQALAASPRLAHLEELHLRNNPVGAEGAAALRASTCLSALRSLVVDD